jgi:hypothetical protein
MIVTDCHPYSIVEDDGFKNLITFAFPHYELPGREYFKSYINKLYEENVEKVKHEMLQAQYITLTSDLWTAVSTETYATITAHFIVNGKLKSYVLDTKPFGSARHTGENIKIVFEATISKWNLDKKVVAIVTDNAYNIVNAVSFSDNISIRCSAHTLQLAIQDAFEEQEIINGILAKCRSIVTHFKHSSQSYAKLSNIQKLHNFKQHKLIQEVSTRWNSTYYMIERLYEQKSALSLFCSENPDLGVAELTNQEWRVLDSLINILEPLEAATRILSGDLYCNISLIIPLITGLIVQLKCRKSTEAAVNKFRDRLVDSLKSRFAYAEQNSLITIATILDPRVKDTCFFDESNKRKAIKCVLDVLNENSKETTVQLSTSSITIEQFRPPPSKRPCFSLTDFILEQQLIDEQTENAEVAKELDNYLKQPICLKKDDKDPVDVLEWWERNKFCFPNLYRLTAKYLSIPSTSCPCERIFSKAGQIISKKRSRLKPKNFNSLLFLMHNLPKIKTVTKPN